MVFNAEVFKAAYEYVNEVIYMKKFIMIGFICSVLVLSSCSITSRVEESNGDSNDAQTVSLNNEINDLKSTISTLENEVETTKQQLIECNEKIPEEPVMSSVKPTVKEVRSSDQWTELEVYSFDFDGDGEQEIVTLFTSAIKDEQGRMMWDDGQYFLLAVDDGYNEYILFNERVQLGRVYMQIAGGTDKDSTGIIITVSTFAGLSSEFYIFNPDDSTFGGLSLLDSGDLNIVHNTMPWD